MGRRLVARIAAAGGAVFGLGFPAAADATPQLGAGATAGVALTGLQAGDARPAAHLGARIDALFLREGPKQMALGPYIDVATTGFDRFDAGGGVEWLVPVDATAFVFSGGSFARASARGWEPGVAGRIFWGSRSFNFHSSYALGAGLFAEGRVGLGEAKLVEATAGVQVDLAYFALPFIFLYEAVRR